MDSVEHIRRRLNMDFRVEQGTRFKVNPNVFHDSNIERIVLDPKPSPRHDDVTVALLTSEPQPMIYHITEFAAGYIWNLGKLPNISNEEILQYFENSLKAGKISPREMKQAKQSIRDGLSRGSITIQRLDSILTREY